MPRYGLPWKVIRSLPSPSTTLLTTMTPLDEAPSQAWSRHDLDGEDLQSHGGDVLGQFPLAPPSCRRRRRQVGIGHCLDEVGPKRLISASRSGRIFDQVSPDEGRQLIPDIEQCSQHGPRCHPRTSAGVIHPRSLRRSTLSIGTVHGSDRHSQHGGGRDL